MLETVGSFFFSFSISSFLFLSLSFTSLSLPLSLHLPTPTHCPTLLSFSRLPAPLLPSSSTHPPARPPPGRPDNAHMWRPQLEGFSKQGFRCVAIHSVNALGPKAPAGTTATWGVNFEEVRPPLPFLHASSCEGSIPCLCPVPALPVALLPCRTRYIAGQSHQAARTVHTADAYATKEKEERGTHWSRSATPDDLEHHDASPSGVVLLRGHAAWAGRALLHRRPASLDLRPLSPGPVLATPSLLTPRCAACADDRPDPRRRPGQRGQRRQAGRRHRPRVSAP